MPSRGMPAHGRVGQGKGNDGSEVLSAHLRLRPPTHLPTHPTTLLRPTHLGRGRVERRPAARALERSLFRVLRAERRLELVLERARGVLAVPARLRSFFSLREWLVGRAGGWAGWRFVCLRWAFDSIAGGLGGLGEVCWVCWVGWVRWVRRALPSAAARDSWRSHSPQHRELVGRQLRHPALLARRHATAATAGRRRRRHCAAASPPRSTSERGRWSSALDLRTRLDHQQTAGGGAGEGARTAGAAGDRADREAQAAALRRHAVPVHLYRL